MAARRPEDRTDVDLILEQISKRLQGIEQNTDKTLRTTARQGRVETFPIGIRAALKQKMIRGIFGNYVGSAIIRKGEKKRMDAELRVQREEELEHERDLGDLRKTSDSSNTISKDVTEKLDNLMIVSQKMSQSMANMNENLIKVSTIVVAIQKRVSPRDVNVGENKKIRYDPLAPAGFQYSEVTESGKSGRIAKKSDANRAAFSAARQMAKEASQDSDEAKLSNEYSEEKKDIKKSEKIDIPTEDINAKRYEKIQETLDELKEKLEGDGFFTGLLKIIASIGAKILSTLMSSIGSILSTVGAIAAALGIKVATTVGTAAKALLARQAAKALLARQAAKAAAAAAAGAGAAAGVGAAAGAGAGVGAAAGAGAGVGAAAGAGAGAGAAASTASKVPGKWQLFLKFLEKKSPALFAKFMARLGTALAGLAVPGPGWVWAAVNLGLNVWTAWEIYKLYKIFTGQSAEQEMESQELVEEDPDATTVAPGSAAPSPSSSSYAPQSDTREVTVSKAESTEIPENGIPIERTDLGKHVGYKIDEPGKPVEYKYFEGHESDVRGLAEMQQHFNREDARNKAESNARAYQRPNQQTGSDMDRESREMYDGKEDRKTNEIKTIVLPQPAPPSTKSSGSMTDMPVTIKVRNTDPTLSTYRASIFDHPVTHPGNFMV